MEAQVLIPMDAEMFWNKMRNLMEQVLIEREKASTVISDSSPQLLKVKEVCDLFQVSKPTIYDWIRKGQLKSVKIESRRFFLANDIQELITRNNVA